MIANLGLAVPSFIGQSGSGTLAALRSPEFIPAGVSSFLFDSHWLYYVILAGIGGALLVLGIMRRQSAVRSVGAAMVGLAVVWMVLGLAFDSPLERLSQAHKTILTAAKEGNAATIEEYLAEDFEFGPNDKKMMAKVVRGTLAVVKLRETYNTTYEVQLLSIPRGAESHLVVIVTLDTPVAGTFKTAWRLEWVDVPGQDWRIRRIVEARYGASEADQVIPPTLLP